MRASQAKVDVLFVTHTRAAYGANRSMAALLKDQAARRTVALVAPSGFKPLQGLLGDVDIPRHAIDIPWAWQQPEAMSPMQRLRRLKRLAQSHWQLRRLAATLRPTVVYTNSSVIEGGRWLARACRAKHIWHLREFGDLDYGFRLKPRRSGYLRRIREADAVICVSRAVARHFDALDLPQTHILDNGVMPLREMAVRRPSRQAQEPWIVGMVGILHAAKGFEAGIRALAALLRGGVHAQLSIFGEGDPLYKTRLETIARELGVARQVKFQGFIDDPTRIFAEIDCLVVAARNEAFGRTTAESMACGVPVVGRATGGTAELIEDGVDGLLFQDEGSELVTKLSLLATQPDLARHLADRALSKAKAAFSEERYTERFNAILEKVLAQ